jgi:Tfp pilus assembly protein PilO
MDGESLQRIKDQLFNKKTQDYTNLTFFFLIFSIFAFFVIRPSLTTAFSLQSSEMVLRETETKYESVVSRIPAVQAALERLRPDSQLLTQALPKTPNLNTILQDIQRAGSKTGLVIGRMTVSNVDLVGGEKKSSLKRLVVELESDTTYDKFVAFQREIHNQRRLKKISNFEIAKESTDASASGILRMKIQVEGYYL